MANFHFAPPKKIIFGFNYLHFVDNAMNTRLFIQAAAF